MAVLSCSKEALFEATMDTIGNSEFVGTMQHGLQQESSNSLSYDEHAMLLKLQKRYTPLVFQNFGLSC